MSRFREDPLLGIARVVLSVGLGIVAVAGVAVLCAIPAIAVFHGKVAAELAASSAPPETFWGIVALLVLVASMLALVFLFIRELRRIVATVADGDPFVPVNADRLVKMAWLSLGTWVLGIPVQALGSWLEAVTEGGDISIGVGDDGMSLSLVLTLFILARVFRKGAEMRADLEGTV